MHGAGLGVENFKKKKKRNIKQVSVAITGYSTKILTWDHS